ncbi:hypothetical protein BJ138DRAFT_1001378, partial [Hygrophoropsis aurantiaca]
LETFCCIMIDESMLLHLAQLPTLQDLFIHLPPSISNTIASNKGFANLQTLSLQASDIDAIVSFLWSARLSLTSIKIALSTGLPKSLPLPVSSVQQLFSSISKGLCHASLTQIEIEAWRTLDYLDGTLDIATLRPLLLFSKMKRVVLKELCSSMNDDALIKLANGWPHLEKLDIKPYTGWKRISGITFQGLASLVHACPLLATLALSIDAAQHNFASSTISGEVIHNDRIEPIDVGDSIIENPVAVARIFRDLFWSLRIVFIRCSRKDHAPLWIEVNQLLRNM